jgi:hypothetical protein
VQPVAAADRQRADRLLGCRVVDCEAATFQVTNQRGPLVSARWSPRTRPSNATSGKDSYGCGASSFPSIMVILALTFLVIALVVLTLAVVIRGR